MKKSFWKNLLLFIIVLFVLIFSMIIIKYDFIEPRYLKKELAKIDFSKYNNLMITAHPDDETLWGGSELINNNYVVVCVTCKTNPVRTKEFKKVMKLTNDKYLMLGYPDKIFMFRSNWLISSKFIKRDLKYIENYNNWNKIVTHNKAGEYGHIHHKMVHKLVWDTAPHNKIYVFGKYCSKEKLLSGSCKFSNVLSDDLLTEKRRILKNYKSQKHVMKMFYHMNPYEDIERATE